MRTKRKSASGGAVMRAGASIQSICRKQTLTTLSSSEAEHVAMAEGFKEVPILRSVWRFLMPGFGIRASRFLRTTMVRSSWRLTLSPTETRSTSTCVIISCTNMSKTESLKSRTQSKYQNAHILKPLAKHTFRLHGNFIMNLSYFRLGDLSLHFGVIFE